MKPLVSVIVPTRNSAETLEACLASITKQTYESIELIVVDNDSTDLTKQIAGKYTKYVYQKGPERSVQRNFGATQSTGGFLLFIDSDMEVTPSVISECVESVLKGQNVSAVTIPEASFGTSFWAHCKQFEKTFYTGIPWIESPRFFRKEAFLGVGGYNEKLISGEDWLLAQQITKHFRIAQISEHILHNEGSLSLFETVSKKFYYATHLHNYTREATALKHRQLNLIARVALFLRTPDKLVRHPLLTLGLLVMKTSEFTAGAFGYLYGNLRFSRTYSPK